MSPRIARVMSMALIGGVGAVLLASVGLPDWAALIGWAAFLDAGASASTGKTLAGLIFGACLAWAALLVIHLIPVPHNSLLWIPRAGVVLAVALFILVWSTRYELLSRASTSLYGLAAVYAALAASIENMTGFERLTGLHLTNPLISVVISLVVGVLIGMSSHRLATALSAA